MSDAKTKPNRRSVDKFLAKVDPPERRDECLRIAKLMRQVTGEDPTMWGESIVGFGKYHYRYATGREGDWFRTGFSPRRQSLTLYLLPHLDAHPELLSRLGKYKRGVCCLYVKRLEDIDLGVLRQLLKRSLADLRKLYP